MSLTNKLFGKPLKTAEEGQNCIRVLRAIPLLGLDALGSASYGPEAALTILIPLGAIGLAYMPLIIGVILVLLGILFFSYRQTIAAYPNGGGAYTVAKQNLGEGAALVAAASLLLDFILNAAVGISAGIGALESAVPSFHSYRLCACLAVLGLITLVNLRGVRDSGTAWMVPAYTFIGSLLIVIGVGIWKNLESHGHPVPMVSLPAAPSAVAPVTLWLILRSFASGCTAMTGVEAVSNAVPVFTEPRVKNAQRTLGVICLVLGLLLGGVGFLARSYHIAAATQEQPNYQSVISQLVSAIMGRGIFYYVSLASVLAVLTLSANTSFAAFPRLCRLLAEDQYLPGFFADLGRRLVYTQGIFILTVLTAFLLVIFGGVTDRLIPLFAVGAFGAFTLSQAGMVMHWRRDGRRLRNPSLLINALGAFTTGVALVIIIIAKFAAGAWITTLIIPLFIALFLGIRKHYSYIQKEIRPPLELQTWKVRSLKIVVPIDGWTRVTERALRFALRISDDVIAIHVTSEETNQALIDTWRTHVEDAARKAGLPEPRLQIIHSPYRQLLQPLLDFVAETKKQCPDRYIGVIIPELVQPRWWEALLHNHMATYLKTMLFLKADEQVIVINVPWYLRSPES